VGGVFKKKILKSIKLIKNFSFFEKKKKKKQVKVVHH